MKCNCAGAHLFGHKHSSVTTCVPRRNPLEFHSRGTHQNCRLQPVMVVDCSDHLLMASAPTLHHYKEKTTQQQKCMRDGIISLRRRTENIHHTRVQSRPSKNTQNMDQFVRYSIPPTVKWTSHLFEHLVETLVEVRQILVLVSKSHLLDKRLVSSASPKTDHQLKRHSFHEAHSLFCSVLNVCWQVEEIERVLQTTTHPASSRA